MTELPRTVNHSHPTLSPEQTHDPRARAWAYVFQCFHSRVGKEGGGSAALDSAKGGSNDSSAKLIIPKDP
jgi:hypothetical protein